MWSSKLIHLIVGSWYSLTNISPLPPLPAPGHQHSSLYYNEFSILWLHTKILSLIKIPQKYFKSSRRIKCRYSALHRLWHFGEIQALYSYDFELMSEFFFSKVSFSSLIFMLQYIRTCKLVSSVLQKQSKEKQEWSSVWFSYHVCAIQNYKYCNLWLERNRLNKFLSNVSTCFFFP